MNTLPVPVAPATTPQDNSAIGHLPQALVDAMNAAVDLASDAQAEATRRAYRGDMADFGAWCSEFDLAPLPASTGTVAAYLASLVDRGLRSSTITRRVAAISDAHRRAGLDSPTAAGPVRSVIKGVRRRLGTKPTKKAPLTVELVSRVTRKIPVDTLLGQRDRALILLGFAGGFRRSELVGLDVAHIERRPEGILATVQRSKGDQEGRGQAVAIPNGTKLRPVEALDAWLKAAGITSGPLFRGVAKGGRVLPGRLSADQVAATVKRRVAAAGLNADLFSGHSVRSGFATSAGRKNLVGTAKHLRHAKIDTTMGYVQAASLFDDHAGKSFL